MTTRFLAAAPVLALVAMLSGCKQEPHCPVLGACGGPDPVGTWELAPGFPSCSEDLYLPPTDLRLAQNNKTPALVAPPEPAVFDWCDQLVASGGTAVLLKDPLFFYESTFVGQSSVQFTEDGRYTASITRTGTFVLDFPAVCVRSFGAQDGKTINPDDPTSPMGNVCKQLEHPIGIGGTNTGAYFNTVCEPNPQDPGGCLCQFDVTATGGPAGEWFRVDNSTIRLQTTNNVPSEVTFCNKGNQLELTGTNGDYLFGVKGLRTFSLRPAMGEPMGAMP
jgi:hypothetical protein